MNSFETIYLLLSKYSKDEINYAISKLKPEDKELLYRKYGRNLNQLNNIKFNRKDRLRFYRVIALIKEIIERQRLGVNYSNGRTIISIYKKFEKYPKEDVNYIINLLPDCDKYILYLRYGSDLENPDTSLWNMKYRNRLDCVFDKIKRLLQNKALGKEIIIRQNGILTIYQIFREYKREEVDSVLEELNEREKYLLYLRYGSDLENPDTSHWSEEYHDEFYNKLIYKIRARLEKNHLDNEVVEKPIIINSRVENLVLEIKNTLMNKEYNILFDNFSEKEILVYILIQRIDDTYSIQDIENYFKIDRSMIIKMVSKILKSTIPDDKVLVKKFN